MRKRLKRAYHVYYPVMLGKAKPGAWCIVIEWGKRNDEVDS